MATANQGTERVEQISFTGKGSEYFRIWIVNLALTILTLGIYSAWAKVRRLQYFYRNTTLAGSSFEYHGNPVAILKGRLIAVALIAVYSLTRSFSVLLGLLVLGGLMAVLPWLIRSSMRFRLANSSYRGLRFHFTGTTGGAYKAFLLWPLLGYITLGILMPKAHQVIKRYQHCGSRFGNAAFRFDGAARGFYSIYFKAFGLLLLMGIGFGMLVAVLIGTGAMLPADPEQRKEFIGFMVIGFIGFYILTFVFIGPWLSARLQNLVWNGTTLEEHEFRSDVRARDLFTIYLTNFILIILTLGLFKPFADIRVARYRLEHTGLLVQGDLDAFLAAREQDVSAMGEETADVFDVDISF